MKTKDETDEWKGRLSQADKTSDIIEVDNSSRGTLHTFSLAVEIFKNSF